MKTFSKTLELEDYKELADPQPMADMLVTHGITHRFEHPHRRWEYGLAFKLLSDTESHSVLDVGGGGSIFAPWLMLNLSNPSVVQVDPGQVREWITKQSTLIGRPLEFIQEDFLTWEDIRLFDAVTCLSVIEHVPEDIRFFKLLCSKVKSGGVLFLTTDFHPSGQAMVGGHIRTYNKDSMQNFIDVAQSVGLKRTEEPNYEHFSVEVNNYTFASLALRKE